jgi:hypothetical protein
MAQAVAPYHLLIPKSPQSTSLQKPIDPQQWNHKTCFEVEPQKDCLVCEERAD